MTNQTDRVRRNTTFAVVERIVDIEPHPDPKITRLEIIVLSSNIKLITGKHYRIGDRGIYLRPGCLIPGWLAEQLWLVGRKRAHAWFEVREIPIGIGDGVKVNSPGLWCGEWYRNDKTAESVTKREEMMNGGGTYDDQGFVRWPFWRNEWREGFTLDGHLGIVEAVEVLESPPHPSEYTRRPPSSAAEHPADNREVAAKTTGSASDSTQQAQAGRASDSTDSAVEALGSTPAAGSLNPTSGATAGGHD